MKKGILLSLLLVVAVLLTGCAKKQSKLVCTQTTSGVDIVFNVSFKGNVVDSMDFSYNMDLSKYSDAQIEAIGKQDFCTRVKNQMASFKDAFTSCNQEITNKQLKVNSVLDVDKAAKSYFGKVSSPESAKKQLESVGYTCTIQ